MTAPDNKGKAWMAEDYERLKREFNEGAGALEIAEKLGRTPAAILSKLESAGLVTLIGKRYHKVDPDPWFDYRLLYKKANASST